MRRPERASGCLAMAALAALWLGPLRVRPAYADTPPSAWDIARDPGSAGAAARWALHVRVERLMHPATNDPGATLDPRQGFELRLEAARSLLEEGGAAASPDVRLRFDLGVVYEQLATVQHRSDLHTKVVDLLAPALAEEPDHPAATDALDALVYAYAKLDRPRDELAVWRRYIPRLRDDRARVGPLMNMGEAEMRIGELDDALATFQETLRLRESLPNSAAVNATYALTLWDIAVALDRNGDPAGAIATAARAQGWTWVEAVGLGPSQGIRTVNGAEIIREEGDVFFVPEWEREWYLALGSAASAQAATLAGQLRSAARDWAESQSHWQTYAIRAASAAPGAQAPAGAIGSADRFVALAHLREQRAGLAGQALLRRASSEERRKAGGGS